MDRSNTFSLTIMVIIMALLAIFIGYLLGNWLIQFVTGDIPPHEQVHQEQESGIEGDAEEITTEEDLDLDDFIEDEEIPGDDIEEDREETPSEDIHDSVFIVQVGAFSEQENAQRLKNELEEKNFHAVINDDDPDLYKIQMAADSENEAEKIRDELIELGYSEAFITRAR